VDYYSTIASEYVLGLAECRKRDGARDAPRSGAERVIVAKFSFSLVACGVGLVAAN